MSGSESHDQVLFSVTVRSRGRRLALLTLRRGSCRGRGAIISCGLHPLPCLRLTLKNTQRGSSAESTGEISDLNREFEISVPFTISNR
jgi:hypothetical protein